MVTRREWTAFAAYIGIASAAMVSDRPEQTAYAFDTISTVVETSVDDALYLRNYALCAAEDPLDLVYLIVNSTVGSRSDTRCVHAASGNDPELARWQP